MRCKSKFFIWLGHLLCVISLSHPGFTQSLNKSTEVVGLHVINTENGYKYSVDIQKNNTMVELADFIKPLFVEWKYATKNNFTGQVMYQNPVAFLRLPAAQALQKVQSDLAKNGFSIKIFDAYRPYSVTKKMWEIVPDERYAANPAKGSGHNRGIAIDVTLVDLKTGKELAMPTDFDDFSEKAHHNYKNLPAEVIRNRALLKATMEKNGFVALETEWWHYSLPNSKSFAVLDLDFDQLQRAAGK